MPAPSSPPASEELVACYDVLRHIAFADGHLSDDEKRVLDDAANVAGARPASRAPRGPLVDAIAIVRSPSLRARTFAAALAMANVDGHCSPEEKTALDQLAKGFGLAPPEVIAGKAVSLTPALVAAKDAANRHFLSQMADAMRSGTLTQARYEALVAELDASLARDAG
jgi:tellurite resistance protein